ncbi:MAG: hypothetical protein Q4D82_01370 [Neisseria sp.]|nr:hypothetical protein [Neisseria sp.]
MDDNPKHELKVLGKMSTQGADKVGKMAAAAIILASGTAVALALYGISLIKWW